MNRIVYKQHMYPRLTQQLKNKILTIYYPNKADLVRKYRNLEAAAQSINDANITMQFEACKRELVRQGIQL